MVTELKDTKHTHKLVLVDGNSLLYRAFFAMRYLSTSEGQPTNAVYGFTMMLLHLIEEEKPDSIVVAFDAPAKTFRHEQFEGYKAQRKPAPDELKSQAPIARELIRAFNIPMVEIEGFEADDVVGTLARMAEEKGYTTLIVTGDLDALQLVSDKVHVLTTIKGVTDTVEYDAKAVEERFGLRPDQMVDYKALKGDPSDNIPGVSGIGDKTASKLIKLYGTLEEVLKNIDQIKESRVQNALVGATEQAEQSKMLATIVRDVPLDINIDECKYEGPDYERLRDLFRGLEFKTLLKRLPEVEGEEQQAAAPMEAAVLGCSVVVESPADLDRLITHLRGANSVAVRVHTEGEKAAEAKLLGIGFSTGVDESYYVRLAEKQAEQGTLDFGSDGSFVADLSQFKDILESETVRKFGHNLKHDFGVMKQHGIALKGISFDTMLGAYVLNSSRGSYKLPDVALEQLGLELPQPEKPAKKSEGEGTDPRTVVCGEVEAVHRLVPVLIDKLERDGLMLLLQDVEMPLVEVLAEMELRGVSIDTGYLAALSAALDIRIREIQQQIYDEAGMEFNIGSPKQLQEVLFEKMNLPVGKKTKTGFSTGADTLEQLAPMYPIVEQILQYRELAKLKSTYADALPKLINARTGRLHTSLNQAVTATGRLSSSEPNLQNIPVRTEIGREIRKAFVAGNDNLLVSADYSQIELRILAHVTGDKALVEAFENDRDIHLATACTIFAVPPEEVTPEMRRRAKTINFAVIYGMSDFGLARELGLTNKLAREYIDNYFARIPGVRKYTEETLDEAREKGYVQTLLGRRRYIPEIHSGNRNYRMFAERAAVNMPIQGTAADIMKIAMINVHNKLESMDCASQMVLQVHDELVFEVPPSEADHIVPIVRDLMETAYPLIVPLKTDVKLGKNWAEMESV
ncbi:MAG TPA: DNA polymerase I [Chloroflexota bacterium]|nr:DNA polymerase I [Chloroflexota bacterium]